MNRLQNNIINRIIEQLNNNNRIKAAGKLCMTNKRMCNIGRKSLYIKHPKTLYNLDVLERKVRGARLARYPSTQPGHYRNNKHWTINNCNCPITKEEFKRTQASLKSKSQRNKPKSKPKSKPKCTKASF